MSYESPHILPPAEHGERLDPRGAIIARLPGRTRPCWAEADSQGRHLGCPYCEETGQIAIRETAIDAVDARDDGMQALDDALAERDENGNRYPEYLGDSIEHLMAQPADGNPRSGGSKSGRGGKNKPKRRRHGEERPPKKWSDGQRELTGKNPNEVEVKYQEAREKERIEKELANPAKRAGRKPRFDGQVRTERLSTSVSSETKAGLREMNADLALLISNIMQEPESLAVVLQARANVAKDEYENALREAAMYEIRRQAGEELPKNAGHPLTPALIKGYRLRMEEAFALASAS